MQLAHLCYVIALGVLAAAFSLGIVSMAFGEASLVPVSIALYLDAAVIPMTVILFASLLYRALHDSSLWIPDTMADTFVAIVVPIAIANIGAVVAKEIGVSLSPLSEMLGLASLTYFFQAAVAFAILLAMLGSILIVVQVVTHKLFDE